MRIQLITILCCFALNPLYAQSQSDVKHELGINATGFISNYANLSGVISTNNPYLFTYKRIQNGFGFRTGLNGFYSKQDIHNEFQPSSDVFNKRLDFRLGVEWQTNLAERWMFFYGVDGLLTINHFESKSFTQLSNGTSIEDVQISSVSNLDGYGVAFVSGLQWSIKPRISLFTEARFIFDYREIRSGSEYSDVSDKVRMRNPAIDFDRKPITNFTRDFSLRIPLDVYIAFKLNK